MSASLIFKISWNWILRISWNYYLFSDPGASPWLDLPIAVAPPAEPAVSRGPVGAGGMSKGTESPRLFLVPNRELVRVHLGLLSLSHDGVPLSRGGFRRRRCSRWFAREITRPRWSHALRDDVGRCWPLASKSWSLFLIMGCSAVSRQFLVQISAQNLSQILNVCTKQTQKGA